MKYDIADIAHTLRGDLSFLEDDDDIRKLCSIFRNRIDNYSGLRQLVIDSTHFLYIEIAENELAELEVKFNDNYYAIFCEFCDKNNISKELYWYVKNLNDEIVVTSNDKVIV